MLISSELPVATEIKNDRYTAAIAKRIAKLRKERGFTQVELAKKLKAPQSIISRYERGELRLHGDLLIKLAKVLEVTPNDLLGIDSDSKATEAIPRQWLKRLQKIKSLSRRDHEALLRTVDALLKSSS